MIDGLLVEGFEKIVLKDSRRSYWETGFLVEDKTGRAKDHRTG